MVWSRSKPVPEADRGRATFVAVAGAGAAGLAVFVEEVLHVGLELQIQSISGINKVLADNTRFRVRAVELDF